MLTSRPKRLLRGAAGLLVASTVALISVAPLAAQTDTDEDSLKTEIQVLSAQNAGDGVVQLTVAIPPAIGAVEPDASSFALLQGGSRRGIVVAELKDEVDVVLVIDTSGSMRGAPLRSAQEAAALFVDEMAEETRIAVVGFGATPSLASGFTSDRSESRRAILGLRARGETALWDALVSAGELIENEGRSAPYVLVLSDGGDTASSASMKDAVDALASSSESTGLYVVTLETAESDHTALSLAAEQLSGQLLSTNESSSLEGLYTEIAGRLSNRYTVRFRPTQAENLVLSVAVDGTIATARTTLGEVRGGALPAESTDASQDTVGEEAAVAFEAELGTVVASAPGLLGESRMLWIGAAAMFGGMLVVFSFLAVPSMQVQTIGDRFRSVDATNRAGLLNERVSGAADRFIKKRDDSGTLDRTLDAAGMDIRAGEFVVLFGVAMLAMGGVFSAMFSQLVGVFMIGFTALAGVVFVQMKVSRRRQAFADQLPSTISILIGSLRAGRGLPQALEMVSLEAAAPTQDEFRRVIIETRVGRDPVESLDAVAIRMQNTDLEWINQAIAINRELGGDLIELLENVARTVRDRNRIALQVKALSAEGRASGWVLMALPILMYVYLRAVNPDYVSLLHTTSGGIQASIVGLVAMVAGGFWIRKLVNIRF